MNSAQALPKGQRIAGHVLSILVALALTASALGKLTHGPQVIDGFAHLGLPLSAVTTIGLIELGCALLSVIPKTRFWGVILVTGYMGGAMLTHMRVGEAPYVQFLVGVLAWLGLALRDPRVRDLALHSP